MTDKTLKAHVAAARLALDTIAFEFQRQRMNREVSVLKLSKELGIDNVRLHHLANGRMLLDDDEMTRVIDWMVKP
jgi:hypothetical protein